MVVLDEKSIVSALKNIDEFKHFNIGLSSFKTDNEFKIFFFPKLGEPFSANLVSKLASKNLRKKKFRIRENTSQEDYFFFHPFIVRDADRDRVVE